MSNKKIFKDGSFLEWVDKETLRYVEGGFNVLVWVDYFEEGLFSNGRVIKASSLVKWDSKPQNYSETIDELKKNEIINKIKEYYLNKKIRIE